MVESRSEEDFSFLKTPEAKAKVMYKRAYGIVEQAVTKKLKKDETINNRLFPELKGTGLDEGLVDLDIPDSLMEGVPHAVDLAFRRQEFRLGLSIASAGGLLENLVTQIEKAPLFEIERLSGGDPYHPSYKGELPDEVREIPGFWKPKYEFERAPLGDILTWLREMKDCVIDHVFKLNGEHLRATQGMLALGDTDAIYFATQHLSVDKVAELSIEHRMEFEEAIDFAESEKRKDLVSRLQEKHVEAVKETIPRHQDKPRRWLDALHYAKEYGFSDEKLEELRQEGVDNCLSEFKRELENWRHDWAKIKEERRYGGGGFMSDRDIEERSNHERRVETARAFNVRGSDRNISTMIQLIKNWPEDKRNELRDQLYTLCDDARDEGESYRMSHRSDEDAFGIAMAFEDFENAFKYGRYAAGHVKNNCYFYHSSHEAHERLRNEVLPHLNEEQKKDYIKSLVHEKPGDARFVAERHGFSEWLMNYLEEENMNAQAAKVADNLRDDEKAKELLVKSGQYDEAIKRSDDPIEKARLHLKIAQRFIKSRETLIEPECYHNKDRYNREVGVLKQVLELASGHDHTPEYLDTVRETVGIMFTMGDYPEGALFGRTAGIADDGLVELLPDEALEDAERNEDFVSCHYIACMRGNQDDVGNYRVLAQEFDQTIPSSLDDFIYVEPKREPLAMDEDYTPF